ncbi:hypothetical protein [Paenibacillus sp. LHD-38]|uniref:hypothetical protein n=1 Tax=Paenibacillus sp. LHD-38 TaxID=3072143 RepID=UPI00280CB5EA|nr:hypothetical protein [Paenibacillus sp. LHD-38]MDQ8734995.1 hypothetical protein [Paenibacillus sp. LHD-38]
MKTFNRMVLSLLIVSAIIMIIGYVQLNNSVLWGTEKASIYVREQMGGSMGTDQYHILLQSFIDQLKWSGSILLSLSGIVVIICIFSLLFKNSSRLS